MSDDTQAPSPDATIAELEAISMAFLSDHPLADALGEHRDRLMPGAIPLLMRRWGTELQRDMDPEKLREAVAKRLETEEGLIYLRPVPPPPAAHEAPRNLTEALAQIRQSEPSPYPTAQPHDPASYEAFGAALQARKAAMVRGEYTGEPAPPPPSGPTPEEERAYAAYAQTVRDRRQGGYSQLATQEQILAALNAKPPERVSPFAPPVARRTQR